MTEAKMSPPRKVDMSLNFMFYMIVHFVKFDHWTKSPSEPILWVIYRVGVNTKYT